MVKHGKIYQFKKRAPTHLESIKQFITRGVADATERLVLHPRRCDIKGAKRHRPQECVIANTADRELHPDAVAVGRHYTWIVFDGLAIRFTNPTGTTKYVDVFDEFGVATTMPIELWPVTPSARLRSGKKGAHKKSTKTRRPPTRKIGVRAIHSGMNA